MLSQGTSGHSINQIPQITMSDDIDGIDDGISADDYDPDNDKVLLDENARKYCYDRHVNVVRFNIFNLRRNNERIPVQEHKQKLILDLEQEIKLERLLELGRRQDLKQKQELERILVQKHGLELIPKQERLLNLEQEQELKRILEQKHGQELIPEQERILNLEQEQELKRIPEHGQELILDLEQEQELGITSYFQDQELGLTSYFQDQELGLTSYFQELGLITYFQDQDQDQERYNRRLYPKLPISVEPLVANASRKKLEDMESDCRNADLVDDRTPNNKKPNGNKYVSSVFLAKYWRLPVPMPSEFNYTCAIILNKNEEGLLHSFLRHHNDWEQVIPGLSTLRTRYMQPIQTRINSILNITKSIARTHFNNLNNFLKNLKNRDNAAYKVICAAMFRAQMMIYNYIIKNVTCKAYHGNGVDNSKRNQVYFNLPKNDGFRFIPGLPFMNIGISEELINPIVEFDDQRPVFSIRTVFFMKTSKVNNFFVDKTLHKDLTEDL